VQKCTPFFIGVYMKKIRIDVPAFAKFNGKMSGVQFVDGVSEREVTPKEARKIGINVRIVEAGTDHQAGLNPNIGAVPAAPIVHSDQTPEPVEPLALPAPVVDEHQYTKDELETIANDEGIKGVREIATKFGVKGVQISQLITGILQAQGNA
jgi:hypothetical protein